MVPVCRRDKLICMYDSMRAELSNETVIVDDLNLPKTPTTQRNMMN